MENLKIDIDVEQIASAFKDMRDELAKELIKGVEELALSTNAHVNQEAETRLKKDSTTGSSGVNLKKFQENLGFEQVSDRLWVISIRQPALWIEEGLPPGFDMKPGLLKGQESRVIPFDQALPPSQQTGFQKSINALLRDELKKRKIGYKKLDLDSNGSPRHAGLDKDGNGIPLKTKTLDIPSFKPGKGNTDIFKRINIYQTLQKDGSVRRDITTFRTVSQNQEGKWIHPGYEGKKFLDEAYEWAMKEWETKILPQILQKMGAK